jgi:hypothetical protein
MEAPLTRPQRRCAKHIGNRDQAKDRARAALGLGKGRDAEYAATFALALSRRVREYAAALAFSGNPYAAAVASDSHVSPERHVQIVYRATQLWMLVTNCKGTPTHHW